MALPFKSNKPGLAAIHKRIDALKFDHSIKFNDLRTRVHIAHTGLLEQAVQFEQLIIGGLRLQILHLRGVIVELLKFHSAFLSSTTQ